MLDCLLGSQAELCPPEEHLEAAVVTVLPEVQTSGVSYLLLIVSLQYILCGSNVSIAKIVIRHEKMQDKLKLLNCLHLSFIAATFELVT